MASRSSARRSRRDAGAPARRARRTRTSSCSTCGCRTWTGWPASTSSATRHPDVKVVMLSASTIPELIAAALRRGASAYLVEERRTRTTSPRRYGRRSRATSARRRSAARSPSARAPRRSGLTERETSRSSARSRGGSRTTRSRRSSGSRQQTVKFHLTNIYRKLGVKNRTEATRHRLPARARREPDLRRRIGDDVDGQPGGLRPFWT